MQHALTLNPPQPSVEIPPAIANLQQWFLEELEQITAHRRLFAQSRARWAATGVSAPVCVPEHAERDLARAVIAATVKQAEALLSQPGAPLVCDVKAWVETHFDDVEDRTRREAYRARATPDLNAVWEAFRPAALWEHIVAQYSPERVIDEARSRAAKKLVSAFSLGGRQDVRQVGGRIELEINMWSEPRYGQSGRRRYTSSRAEYRHGLVEAMRVFMVASGLDDDRFGLERLAQDMQRLESYDFDFASRDRLDYAGGTSMVCFNNAVKIYFSLPVAQALNLFVSEYAAEMLADRMAA